MSGIQLWLFLQIWKKSLMFVGLFGPQIITLYKAPNSHTWLCHLLRHSTAYEENSFKTSYLQSSLSEVLQLDRGQTMGVLAQWRV